jgi:hypothetical protein
MSQWADAWTPGPPLLWTDIQSKSHWPMQNHIALQSIISRHAERCCYKTVKDSLQRKSFRIIGQWPANLELSLIGTISQPYMYQSAPQEIDKLCGLLDDKKGFCAYPQVVSV